MKKLLAVFLIAIMSLAAGCGSEPDKAAENPETTVAEEAQTPEADTERPVDASWFDDAVFVGDSVTLKLSYYNDENPEALGGAQFFCAGSLGYNSALWDIDDERAVHPYYKGQVELCENCAVRTGATKVFVMLGMNDIAVYGTDGTLEATAKLLKSIKKNSPDVTFYLQSVTPIMTGHEIGDLNNENIREFNAKLEAYCARHKLKYLDIYSLVADEDGYLEPDYCGDQGAQGIHFTSEACRMWSEYLKENV